VLLALLVLVACVSAHMYTVGSTSVPPNSPAYFNANPITPCGLGVSNLSTYLNVTVGSVFPVVWTLVVNHNLPPQPNGYIHFNFASGLGSTKYMSIASDEPVVNQANNDYFVKSVVIPNAPGYGTIQVIYDANGAADSFPAYYQCVSVFVSV